MKIFINPGHGGNDSGAVNYQKYKNQSEMYECSIVLRISQKVKSYLENVGYEVILFQFDGLKVITDKVNNSNADLFVSIHCNSFNESARGTETFCYYNSVSGRKLATCIQNQLIASIPTIDRGVKENGYYVLRCTDCPAALVECAFIDQDDDADLLVNYEDDFAKAIARGVTDYVAKA